MKYKAGDKVLVKATVVEADEQGEDGFVYCIVPISTGDEGCEPTWAEEAAIECLAPPYKPGELIEVAYDGDDIWYKRYFVGVASDGKVVAELFRSNLLCRWDQHRPIRKTEVSIKIDGKEIEEPMSVEDAVRFGIVKEGT